MTIRTFWTIFLKILGIWLVLDSVTVIPQFISSLFYPDPYDTGLGLPLSIAVLLLTIGVYLFILRLFVFKTAWLIDKLHLEKGFDEEKIVLNVQLTTVLTVTTIVIGGLMFVDSLPALCKEIFVFLQQKNIFRENPESGWIIFHLVKTILSYLIMTNSKQVVAFFNKQTQVDIYHS
ncbi:MAG: hypothetical protein IPN13_07855 [Bacteroidetes bacterium]|nr:hypothetical protein [Bacteroidota bacterium]